MEDFPNAVADYSAAIAENPEDIADMYFMRGFSKSLLDTEDVVGACEDFRKAKSLGYSMKDLNGLNDYCGDKDLEE